VRFTVRQVAVLRLQAREGFCLERIVLHVLHPRLGLPLVPRHVRLGRKDDRDVTLAERWYLGIQLQTPLKRRSVATTLAKGAGDPL